jgi:hypothetical protein
MAKKARGYTVNGVRKALAVNVGGVMKIAAHDDCCCGVPYPHEPDECCECFDINETPSYYSVTFSGVGDHDCPGYPLIPSSNINGTYILPLYNCYNCIWQLQITSNVWVKLRLAGSTTRLIGYIWNSSGSGNWLLVYDSYDDPSCSIEGSSNNTVTLLCLSTGEQIAFGGSASWSIYNGL